MTSWGEKPGGFSGGGFNDSAWLGNAKRQSLFRQSAGPISWAGKPNTPGMDASLPANLSNQQSGQPVQQQPASMFSPAASSTGMDIWGRTPDQARSQVAEWNRQEEESRLARQSMQDGSWQRQINAQLGNPMPARDYFNSLFGARTSGGMRSARF